jgi:hypothetical protein
VKVYLDLCSLQRPLDTRSQVRIALEAEAVLGLLLLCQGGHFELVSSDALLFEAGRNPQPLRRKFALEVLATAPVFSPLSPEIAERTRFLASHGLTPLDAAHLASAEAVGARWLVTCDDRFLKRARALGSPVTRLVGPLELIQEVSP